MSLEDRHFLKAISSLISQGEIGKALNIINAELCKFVQPEILDYFENELFVKHNYQDAKLAMLPYLEAYPHDAILSKLSRECDEAIVSEYLASLETNLKKFC